ncbi:gamma-glutamyl-gamma-aminobutyrate hydrolase family protein [Rothia kristinae]|uniref:Gamma-glutamyl-gamma-aminobutyrate hydrolase family protein n=1 Tax=Rothia kristinae TaxID=37923 RepID=A0A7T3CJ74_9MICC|nr:gamma-glutamyl-gamma-aminobutyrate hydrolase family protein [Rothia kristinae]TDP54425.1 putative glutamine amidotransferase [Kocuria sp. AG109]SIM14577.1 peptidase C26 [Mycobacteroides abscessus subsp. abscessus]MED6047132.1 gamma-glutamyl-gamma-aminobutyrate hydrolase family protein [Rothia kristinae]QPT54519.1 gamma-glutamyl-gamma-aminobutyrate hydrolase family protein [Rothia kristinae]SQC37987.1 Putative glutamine amidotransferase Rv2859c [Rothia kristinae]
MSEGTGRRPVIGIITNLEAVAHYQFPGYPRITVNEDYPRSVAASGGAPFLMAPSPDLSVLPAQLDALDGLILAGGVDVDPQRYGQDPLIGCGPVDPVRDAYELEALRLAGDSGLPVFAICRGMQLVNVFFGGTLVQDLRYAGTTQQHSSTGNPALGVHAIDVEPGTFLAEALAEARTQDPGAAGMRRVGQPGTGTDGEAGDDGEHPASALVNSYHHQVIDRLGEGLRVCARARDGVIEALDCPGDRMDLTAVEWHPEMMSREDALAQALFTRFIRRTTPS